MSFANDTPIAMPAGTKAIVDFEIGDSALGGSMSIDPARVQMVWAPAVVTFSQGTPGGGSGHIMAFIECGSESTMNIVCTMDSLFITTGGEVVRAKTLIPGVSMLLGADGSPVPLNSVTIAMYAGGIHHIGLGEQSMSTNGHLLNAGGVVVGDFYLQIEQELG